MLGDASLRANPALAKGGTHPRTQSDASALVTRRGLLLPKRMAFEKWVGVGSYLSNIMSASSWCLGDWLVYGEASFNGRYRDAIELTSLDYQTLRNHAWVARCYPMSRRREKLSFTHHAEVASLSGPEQDFWLGKAEEHGWSAKKLRREVKDSLAERGGRKNEKRQSGRELNEGQKSGEETAASTDGAVSLKVSVPADRLEFCRATAKRLGLDLEAWAAQTLMAAAEASVRSEVPQQRQAELVPSRHRVDRSIVLRGIPCEVSDDAASRTEISGNSSFVSGQTVRTA
ncbi:LmbU family transcriptional regulator [Streptomyces sp. NRRL S-920]|uniref:LmbU family transcriptional regulator n=1 Tax=Streptomyces sp. NRRL S-920 TaxID=1463921 RepID=UPI002277365E|nr:LmbU family transcriptional regulator [Streptomyces sp. NRRL S-920]